MYTDSVEQNAKRLRDTPSVCLFQYWKPDGVRFYSLPRSYRLLDHGFLPLYIYKYSLHSSSIISDGCSSVPTSYSLDSIISSNFCRIK